MFRIKSVIAVWYVLLNSNPQSSQKGTQMRRGCDWVRGQRGDPTDPGPREPGFPGPRLHVGGGVGKTSFTPGAGPAACLLRTARRIVDITENVQEITCIIQHTDLGPWSQSKLTCTSIFPEILRILLFAALEMNAGAEWPRGLEQRNERRGGLCLSKRWRKYSTPGPTRTAWTSWH